MTLACMIKVDKDSLLCDLAETYHIYDFRSLPVLTLATLSAGLRDDSRIKIKLSDSKMPLNSLLLISLLDCMRILLWSKTDDAIKDINRPISILNGIFGIEENNKLLTFETANDFEEMRLKIIRGEFNGN